MPAGPSQGQLVEGHLARAADVQAERYARLEHAIGRLAQRLEPMLQGGSQDVMVDPQRIQRLEDKVQALMTTLAPIMDMEGPWAPPKKDKKLRPPTPPRALIGPAAPKLPRAGGGQGSGHGVMRGESRQSYASWAET